MNSINMGYVVAAVQIVFGLAGLITGWISNAESLTILMLGLSVFGIHNSNIALGRSLGSR